MTKSKNFKSLSNKFYQASITNTKDKKYETSFKELRQQNTLLNIVSENESIKIEENWIYEIEKYLVDIETIINSYIPKNKAGFYKNDPSTIQGKIIKQKDLKSYEYRFVKTLINKLFMFVAKAYEFSLNGIESFNKNNLNYENTVQIDSIRIKCKIDFEVINLDETINEKNNIIATKITEVYKKIIEFKKSDFMVAMANIKEVPVPIMKTNLLLRQPIFNRCYMLWLFIDKYPGEGFKTKVSDKKIRNNQEYYNDFARLILELYAISDKISFKE